jgi:hypothetical protein
VKRVLSWQISQTMKEKASVNGDGQAHAYQPQPA